MKKRPHNDICRKPFAYIFNSLAIFLKNQYTINNTVDYDLEIFKR
jgi:hypothetical protein